MRSKKSQVTTELIMISSLVFIIFLAVAVVINDRNDNVLNYKKYLSAKDIADNVAYHINNAYISGFGAKESFYVPSALLDGTSFTLKVRPNNRIVVIEWDENHYVAPILTSHISGSTTLSAGKVYITNVLGEINIG